VTRQQRMGEQSRLSTWPDVNVLKANREQGFRVIILNFIYFHTKGPKNLNV
jgi:hypothetical protein